MRRKKQNGPEEGPRMLSRRQVLSLGALTGAGILFPWKMLPGRWPIVQEAMAQTPALLDAANHPKFIQPLPMPERIDTTTGKVLKDLQKGKALKAEIKETKQFLGLVDANGKQLKTEVWGYKLKGAKLSYPGATLVAQRGNPVSVKWENKLKEFDQRKLPPWETHLLPVDTTIHLARPERLPKAGIPTVTHLHGARVESASDGIPEAWFTKGFKETGPTFVKETYTYHNDQEATTLWYHDHALGVTRLNVYAGLAGFYLLRDDNENQLIADGILPSGPYEKEIVIQDRMFTADGQLFIPTTDPGLPPNAPDPSIVAEFFGDFNLVNGMAWPVLDVEPSKYRFRLLNGADSRFYVLELRDAQTGGTAEPFFQIGTDGGLLPKPVPLTQLILAPAERADLIIDFTNIPQGTELFLRNFGPDEPFKGLGVGAPADEATTGQVMKFRVNQPLLNISDATIGAGTTLRSALPNLGTPTNTRKLVLFEGEDEFGRLRPQLGTLAQGSLLWDEPITENPGLNDVEVWEVFNATEDAHPIHVHLVQFQILSRQAFTGDVVTVGADPIFGGTKQVLQIENLTGNPRPPEANEAGLKDTARMLPGEVTRVIAKFDLPGRYVWHCHILSHEDHEMMRPYFVG